MRKLIQELAIVCNALRRKAEGRMTLEQWDNGHWNEQVEAVKALLPSGSGFDAGTKIELDKCRDKKIVLKADFHHMDQHGYYDGWTEHEVILTPAFDGFDLRVTGRNKREIKDYIAHMFYDLLSRPVHMEFNIAQHGRIQFEFAD